MKLRAFGASGLEVSEVGLGAYQLGAASVSDDQARALVHAALDAGCSFFDTAPNYGHGLSEARLGQLLSGRRDQVVLNTKFGHSVQGPKNFDPAALTTSLDASLARLQTHYVDSLILHNPPEECLDGDHPLFAALRAEQRRGRIRHYGVSLDFRSELERTLARTDSQVVEVMFNVFHQEPLPAFQAAHERGVALVIKVPLDSGFLSGRFDEESSFDDIRSRWTRDILERRARYLDAIRWITDQGHSLVEAALAFVLAHPQVSTVIPGSRTLTQLRENMASADKPLPASSVERLHRTWDEVFRRDALPW